MGNYTSKLFAHHCDDNKVKLSTNIKLGVMEKHPCTPIMTKKHSAADPRSATIGIVRTPIETAVTPTGINTRVASAIPKHLRIKQYLETDIDNVIPTFNSETELFDPRSPNAAYQRTPIAVQPLQNYLTPVVRIIEGTDMITPEAPLNGLDPRSPATNFDRTPILKPKSPKLQNSAQINIKRNNIELSKPQMLYCETIIDSIPEIQVLPEITSNQLLIVNKRLQLSETTDNQLKSNTDTKSSSDESDFENQVTIIQNIKPLLKDSKLPDEDELINSELTTLITEQNQNKEIEKLNVFDPLNVSKKLFTEPEEKIRIWRDSISPGISSDLKVEGSLKREEIMIDFDDNQLIQKSHQSKINENFVFKSDENVRNKILSGKIKKSHQSKKDSKNLFEDVKMFNTEGNTVNTCKSRTPLGNRSNSHHKSEIPAKSPQQMFRNKCLSTMPQQENTPPRTKSSAKKTNFTHWDMDKTVII